MSRELDGNDATVLVTAEAQAKNWLGALTALTGLVATVLVLKGPDSAADVPYAQRVTVVALLVVGFLLLVTGTVLAYIAAYRSPGKVDSVRRSPLAGLHDRVLTERLKAAQTSEARLKNALEVTLVGIAALLAANVVSWFPPEGASSPDKTVCIFVEGKKIMTVAASSVEVKDLSSGATVSACS